MDLFDQVRLLQQDLGRPQRILKIATVGLQFRGKCAVQNQVLAGSQMGAERGVLWHGSFPKKKTAACSLIPPYNVRSREQAAVL
ncbi:hypothetical protein D3C73_1194450 [compost metagenome]